MSDTHRAALQDILQWRRDVRHFRTDPIPNEILNDLRAAMDLAPSVGNARPWRVLDVRTPSLRQQVIADFTTQNAKASALYDDTKRADYMALKLAGLTDAPTHLAVFTETAPSAGHGLGRQTMPEMLSYSTVAAIHTLWLAARAQNIGMGWVSIIDPAAVTKILDAPATWQLTAYLCLGYPAQTDYTPLLDRAGWQASTPTVWTTR